MRTTKKIWSMILILGILLTMLPSAGMAKTGEYVYLSVSYDGKYIKDKNGNPFVYYPVPLDAVATVDLEAYGLEELLYDADGDGKYDTTALQLLIYAHEELYGGSWSDVDFDPLPGSSYFKDGIFGFTENLVYFLNGDFPVDESQSAEGMTIGATSDRIVLKAGDFLDVASFSCYSFLWDQLGGFHLFADLQGNYVHDYTAVQGESLSVKLKHSFCDLMFGQSWVKEATEYTIYYGKSFGKAEGSVVTDEQGIAKISFAEAGDYYLWCDGARGTDDGTHDSCDGYDQSGEPCIVSSPAYAKVTVTAGASPESQDVTEVLQATMAQLATTVTEPNFGTNAGEWTVFGLARGNYFGKNDPYFTAYYDRIVEYVNTTAPSLNMNGALDKNKSTDNSRLIVALSAIGRNATSVGDWDLVEAYSANGMNWIRKQGMNGTIWTLIALDSGNYATSDPTIRQQCVDSILSFQHNDGGWSLVTAKAQPSNVDITGMTLVALYPYRNQPEVAQACEEALTWLSESQLETGGFPYGKGETSESCVWAIVACTAWGINPDTDPRFIKNGISAVDNLLSYYLEEEAMFAHQGKTSNAMATDQACYALVAYDRFLKGEKALFDYSDVSFGEDSLSKEEMTATLGLPAQINGGEDFHGIIGINKWDNEGGYKLIDFLMTVPQGVTVTDVTASDRLNGGEVVWNVEADSGKLRVVYFDANQNQSLTVSGEDYPAELFSLSFTAQTVSEGSKLNFALSGMSVKLNSDSRDENSMIVVNTQNATGTVQVVEGISFSAVCLYQGDGVDLIPTDKKAVAVAVTGIKKDTKLSYDDGNTKLDFSYSAEISTKSGVATFVALVDSAMDMEKLVNEKHYKFSGDTQPLTFGDTNGDGVINAQDALNAVDAWVRKGELTEDRQILTVNVNGDSRINTYDALAIVEHFVKGTDFAVVIKAATLTTNP